MNSTNSPFLRRSSAVGAALLSVGSIAFASPPQNPNSGATTTAQELKVELENEAVVDEDAKACLVTACANLGPPETIAFNLCFVIDISTTMAEADVDIALTPDANGDGFIQRIDAAIEGLVALSSALSGTPNIQFSLVAFAKDSAVLDLSPALGQQSWISDLNQDLGGSVGADFEEVLRSLDTGGLGTINVAKFTTHDWAPGTDYTEALIRMNEAFASAPAFGPGIQVNNIGFFISDGLPNQTDIVPKWNDLGGPLDLAVQAGTTINTYGVGPDVATICDPGQPLDLISGNPASILGDSGGTCTAVTDPSTLTAVLGGASATKISKLELFINNVLVSTVNGPVDEELKLIDFDVFPFIHLGNNEFKAVATAADGTVVTAIDIVDKTACLLLVGLYPALTHLGNGDFIYVDTLLMYNVTETSVPTFTIPNIPSLVGMQIFFQVGMHNQAMFPQNSVQMSNGLRVTIGGGAQSYGGPTGIYTWFEGSAALGGTFKTPFDVLAM